MFKGTRRYAKGEIDYITTRLGGSNNAFTSLDSTAYYFSFASDRWLTALDIEASRMRDNLFDAREFEMEKQVVIEELKMDLDQPWSALRCCIEREAFRSHPYRYPVIGLLDDLRALTPEQVEDFYASRYCPANAILVLVGDFRKEAALEEVERRFGSMPAGEECRCEPPLEEPRQDGPLRLELERPTRIARLLAAFPAPSVSQDAHYPLQILDRVLSEGKLCRLYRSLVEEQRIASSASSEINETYHPYLLLVRMELRGHASLEEAEERLFEEMRRLAGQALPEDDLVRAQNQCCTQALQDLETTLDQAIQLGVLESLGGFEYWNRYFERIRSVTGRDVQRAAARYLDPSRAVVGRMPGIPQQAK